VILELIKLNDLCELKLSKEILLEKLFILEFCILYVNGLEVSGMMERGRREVDIF
jgi:hypothetical protein